MKMCKARTKHCLAIAGTRTLVKRRKGSELPSVPLRKRDEKKIHRCELYRTDFNNARHYIG